MNEFTVVFHEGSDEVRTPGVDLGGKVKLVHRAGSYCVLHVAGGSHWSGIGSRTPHPAQWLLVLVERVTTTAERSASGAEFTRDRAIVLREREPGRDWRHTKAVFIADADARASETT